MVVGSNPIGRANVNLVGCRRSESAVLRRFHVRKDAFKRWFGTVRIMSSEIHDGLACFLSMRIHEHPIRKLAQKQE